MRKTREELLKSYPWWDQKRNDIVATFYGDEPRNRYTKKYYDFYLNCFDDQVASDILAGDAWIWRLCGDFDDYRLLNGDMKIGERILDGDIAIQYGGKIYDIYFNDIYGEQHLSIMRISSEICRGWTNFQVMCPSRIESNNIELDDEIIQKVFDSKEWDDYGEAVQRFRAKCHEVYESDRTNHYLDEWRGK